MCGRAARDEETQVEQAKLAAKAAAEAPRQVPSHRRTPSYLFLGSPPLNSQRFLLASEPLILSLVLPRGAGSHRLAELEIFCDCVLRAPWDAGLGFLCVELRAATAFPSKAIRAGVGSVFRSCGGCVWVVYGVSVDRGQ